MLRARGLQRRLGRLRRRVAALARGRGKSTPYERWLEQRLRKRNRGAAPAASGRFSILTTVFDTPTAYLAEAARSVFEQTIPPCRWILLDNGSTRPDVVALIEEIARNERVRRLRVDENVGIMNGMRRCLEAASGDYVVPMDSDDVLLPDALALLEQAIIDHASPGLVYTDEDVLQDGRPQSPYLRPDWDPVLNLCTSYIFHLCAFRRDDALRLGVYADDCAQWCHDWDTVHRFHADGATIVHVPEVAYHWRAHPRSSTHRDSPEEGSLQSQRHVLQSALAAHERPELFDLQPFPIDRGAPEWWIRRRREAPGVIDVVLRAEGARNAAATVTELVETTGYPFRTITVVGAAATQASVPPGTRLVAGGGVRGLARALSRDGIGLTLVYADQVRPEGDEWPWEALALSELHADGAVFSGRILNRDRIVVAGGEILGFGGLVGPPDRGRAADDPGYYALALKQRSVGACHSSFFLARTKFLQGALEMAPTEATIDFLGAWLGITALAAGKRVVFSPLITAVAPGIFTGDQQPSEREAAMFAACSGSVLPDTRWYSPHFAREHGRAYELSVVRQG